MLETGIKVIDLLAPYAKGGKIGLFGGAGVGKTVLSQQLSYALQVVRSSDRIPRQSSRVRLILSFLTRGHYPLLNALLLLSLIHI